MPAILQALASCIALALASASAAPPRPTLHDGGTEGYGTSTTSASSSAVIERLINATGSDLFHIYLHPLRGQRRHDDARSADALTPWFDGFETSDSAAATAAAAAATVGHPIRRTLEYLRDEDIELETALSWMSPPGIAASSSTHYRRGYQLVDNYLVRMLAGRSAWELPPGSIGAAELMAARIALGKFEVLLRQDCIVVDLPLLDPYLEAGDTRANMSSAIEGISETGRVFLPPGTQGEELVRANRWDMQLWYFANDLVMSRSTTIESYMCGSSTPEMSQKIVGRGRRAVVFNSPEFHLTGVSMFSCTLMSLGYLVTAVLKEPVPGFEQLLPCADQVVLLEEISAGTRDRGKAIAQGGRVNSTVAAILGLTPDTQQAGGESQEGILPNNEQKDPPEDGGGSAGGNRARVLQSSLTVLKQEVQSGDGRGEPSVGGRKHRHRGLFDVSVLCTTFPDLNVLFDPRHSGMDPRLVEALLWNVKTSIWNMHGVSRGFGTGGVPPQAHDFAARVPSKQGHTPPPTFLTVYGEHVKTWENALEEAYEGWGQGPDDLEGRKAKESNLRELFPHSGVVYPIVPTGNMRLQRPSRRFSFHNHEISSGDTPVTLGRTRRVNFVVQGTMVSDRRDYKTLLSCLEAMCSSERENFSIKAVGSYGNLTQELDAHPCTQSRYTEGRSLEYKDFYARISDGDFVVTASAGDDYEYDRATSSVPTALLLETPLVMASSLLNVYPCLGNSRVHSMVANDDLCLNLHAAYDLTPAEYDEMELEARDCKLEMWRQTRETVADIVLKGAVLG